MPFSTSDLTRRYFHSSHENESFNQMLISKRICTTSPRSFNEFQVKQVFSKDGWKLETFHEPATVTERGRHFFLKVFPIPIHLRKSYLFLPFFFLLFFYFFGNLGKWKKEMAASRFFSSHRKQRSHPHFRFAFYDFPLPAGMFSGCLLIIIIFCLLFCLCVFARVCNVSFFFSLSVNSFFLCVMKSTLHWLLSFPPALISPLRF